MRGNRGGFSEGLPLGPAIPPIMQVPDADRVPVDLTLAFWLMNGTYVIPQQDGAASVFEVPRRVKLHPDGFPAERIINLPPGLEDISSIEAALSSLFDTCSRNPTTCYVLPLARPERINVHLDDIGRLFVAAPPNCLLPAAIERYRAQSLCRLLVTGGSDDPPVQFIVSKLDQLVSRISGPVELVSPLQPGADLIAAAWATRRGFRVNNIFQSRKLFGEAAPAVVQDEVFWSATHAVGFDVGADGPGRSILTQAKALGMPVREVSSHPPAQSAGAALAAA